MSNKQSNCLNFQVNVPQRPANFPKGPYAAQLSEKSLVLVKNKQVVAEYHPQVSVQKKSSNSVVISNVSESITLQPIKLNGYPDRISDAIVSVLSGQSISLKPTDFEFPRLIMFIAASPLALIAIGGLIGGAIGGAGTGINLYLARQHRWPLALRILSILALSIGTLGLYIFIASLFLQPRTTQPTVQAPVIPPPNTTAAPPAETPPPPKPAAIEALTTTGTFRIAIPDTEVTAAIVRDDRASLLIACQDGTLRTLSLLDQTPSWKPIARLPSAPHTIRKLAADYYLITNDSEKFLFTPTNKLLGLSWRWECIPSSSILCVATDTEMRTGTINFGTIERTLNSATNSSGSADVTSLSMDFLESKDGPALSIAPPPNQSLEDITSSGINPIAFGFRDGTIALKVSGEWTIEKTRESPVTCIGSGNGFGFADGIVDTGFVDEKLRFRRCGSSPISGLLSFQVWTLAINQQGECWAFVAQDPAEPQRKFSTSEYGQIKEILQLDYATAVVSHNQVTFMSSSVFAAKVK